MHPLQAVNDSADLASADLLRNAVPSVMIFLRATFRRGSRSDPTITQVRALAIIRRCGQGTLTEIADLLGISSPAASRLVEALVTKGLIRRQTSRRDRRRLSLQLTPKGVKALDRAWVAARQSLAERLGELSKAEMATVQAALTRLDGIFRRHVPT
jgi:DNA-binding MarR family transcriptional regulator